MSLISTTTSFLHNRHKIGRFFASVSGLIFVRVFPPQMGQSTHFSVMALLLIIRNKVFPAVRAVPYSVSLISFLVIPKNPRPTSIYLFDADFVGPIDCFALMVFTFHFPIPPDFPYNKSIDTAENASHLFLSLIIFSAFRSYLMSRPFLNAFTDYIVPQFGAEVVPSYSAS